MAATAPNYGLDAPRRVRHMFSRAGWTLLTALVLYYINQAEYPGPAARMGGAIALIGIGFLAAGAHMIWSSRAGKLRLRDEMLDSLTLEGSERVLDVGCGLGLLAIGAAKRLKSGRVTAIDNWDPHRLSGNSMEAARENAKSEGVGEKVRLENFDPNKFVYPNDHFDAVVSSLFLHTISDEYRAQTIREMFRVLKPGGKMVIQDVLATGEIADTLREAGAKEIETSKPAFMWVLPSRVISARK